MPSLDKVLYGLGLCACFLIGFWVGFHEGVRQTTEEAIAAIEEVTDSAIKGMADIVYDSLRESGE